MAAYVPSLMSGASATALALEHSAVARFDPPYAHEPTPSPKYVPTMTLAQEMGPTLWKTVAVTVTSRLPDRPGRRPGGNEARSVPGQVVSCGNLVVVHGTRKARGVDPTAPGAAADQSFGASTLGAINAICFRRVRRDIVAVVDESDDIVPIICVPTKRDAPDIAARQLTACETKFTIPTPMAAARGVIPPPPTEPGSAMWNVYLPDGRSLQEVSNMFVGIGGYELAMTPINSLCYRNGSKDDLDDLAVDKEERDSSGISVLCHPADADASASEAGLLML